MPRATLTFDLPDEEHEFRDAIDGVEYRSALEELREYIRSMTKHGAYGELKTKEAVAHAIYEKLFEICHERGIEI